MSNFEALILGILQGITEFLPISSSGHLIFGESFLGLEVENLKTFDIVVHMGTLLAIIIYFWEDFKGLIVNFFKFIFRRETDKDYKNLIGYIIIGTLPAVIIGLNFETFLDFYFRNVRAVAMLMVLVGVVFILGEVVYKRKREEASLTERIVANLDKVKKWAFGSHESGQVQGLNFKKALIIGLAQAVALLPGVSRSGSTIIAGLFQGIERREAARFSFLLGIPAILGAGILTGIKVASGATPAVGVGTLALIIGFISSFVFGLASIYFLMKFLKNNTLHVFAIYLILLGLSVGISKFLL